MIASSSGVRGRQHPKIPPADPVEIKYQLDASPWSLVRCLWGGVILRCFSNLALLSRLLPRRKVFSSPCALLALVGMTILVVVLRRSRSSSLASPGLRVASPTLSCTVREPPTAARVFSMSNTTLRARQTCGKVRAGRPEGSLPWLLAAEPYSAAFDECAASRPAGGLWLTYASKEHADGAGSQLQRIIGLLSISKALNLGYIHTPIGHVGYQGLAALEKGSGNSTTVARWNAAFDFSSATTPGATCRSDVESLVDGLGVDGCRHIYIDYPKYDDLEALARSSCGPHKPPVLVHATHASDVIDKRPAFGRHPHLCFASLLPWLRLGEGAERLRIAVHVRRGELFVVDSDRMLPNSYYVTVCAQLSSVLSVIGIPHIFEIYTEQARGKLTVSGSDHGIAGRIAAPVVIDPAASHLEDFEVVEPKVMVVNLDAIETLQRMATADVLVMSRSSFSYVAASLMDVTRSIVVYYPFWHRPLSGWTVIDEGMQPGPVPHELWLRTRSILAAAASRIFVPPACDAATRGVGIPRIVHVVALEAPSMQVKKLSNALQALNPGYTINIVDAAAASSLVKLQSQVHATRFDSLANTEARTILVQALLLYTQGGVSLDLRVQPLVGFDALLERARALSSSSTRSVFCIGARNAPPFEGSLRFVAVPAGNPVFLSLADSIADGSDAPAAEGSPGGPDASAAWLSRRFFLSLADRYPAMRPYAAVDGAYFLQEVEVGLAGRVYNTLPDESVLASTGWADDTWPAVS